MYAMKRRLRILHLEDEPDFAELVSTMLVQDGVEADILRAGNRKEFQEALEKRGFDLILSDYHLPSFADVPRTEVLFADTSDSVGPMGAKSMSESPYNPVAAALGNALANATGIRFTTVPFKPDRLWPKLHEKFGS